MNGNWLRVSPDELEHAKTSPKIGFDESCRNRSWM
jgi:hypothetical protein